MASSSGEGAALSAALYKFLQKAILKGEPGAEQLKKKYTARARAAIIDSLAPRSKAADMAKSEVFGGLNSADGEARDMYVKWLAKNQRSIT